jgi:hypothetical protein
MTDERESRLNDVDAVETCYGLPMAHAAQHRLMDVYGK